MRTNCLYLTIACLLGFACSNEPVQPFTHEARMEGTIVFYQAGPAIGGECDPSGYILQDFRWITGEPSYRYARVYLKDGQSPSFAAQRVCIGGTLDSIMAGGVETPRRKFPLVHVTWIQKID